MSDDGQQRDSTSRWRLIEADERAVDALIQHGFDVASVPEQHRARSGRAVSLFGLLSETNHAADPMQTARLIEATLSRISAETKGSSTQPVPERNEFTDHVELIPDDEEAVDAWVNAGMQVSKVPGSLRSRAERIEMIGAMIRTVPGIAGSARPGVGRSGLVESTLSKIQAMPQQRMEPIPISQGARWRGRLTDVLSMAAVLLIATAVIWPVAAAARSRMIRTSCEGNLGRVASAMHGYAGDYRDALPLATAGLGGGSWWEVGNPARSNSANLYTLPRAGYTGIESLACGGNPHAVKTVRNPEDRDWRNLNEVSYSYRVMAGQFLPAWSLSRGTVVLADRSPVVLRAVRRQIIFPLENSPNHGGLGQTVLFGDGSALWSASPMVKGDNIWLPGAIERAIDHERMRRGLDPLRGDETPCAMDDAMLGP